MIRAALALVAVLTSGTVMAEGIADPYLRPQNPTAPHFAFNPTTPEKAALGCRLFFDPRLSKANDTSCATCHKPDHGWADARATSRIAADAVNVPITRRTQTILGAGWVPKLGWSGGIDALEGFVLAPIARAHEMAQDLDALVVELSRDGDYGDALRNAFGSSEVTVARISQSLAAFVRTRVPGTAPFDRWRAGDEDAVSSSVKEGFELFTGKAGCVACHGGWRFTDDAFHDIGLAATGDIGRALHDEDDPKARFAFKTPSLREVAERPPYMHDGSLKTLAAVIDHYTDALPERPSLALERVSLSDREKLILSDFLKSLSSDSKNATENCLP